MDNSLKRKWQECESEEESEDLEQSQDEDEGLSDEEEDFDDESEVSVDYYGIRALTALRLSTIKAMSSLKTDKEPAAGQQSTGLPKQTTMEMLQLFLQLLNSALQTESLEEQTEINE